MKIRQKKKVFRQYSLKRAQHFLHFLIQNDPHYGVQARLCLCRDELSYAFLPSIMGLSMKIFYRLSEIRCGFFRYKKMEEGERVIHSIFAINISMVYQGV